MIKTESFYTVQRKLILIDRMKSETTVKMWHSIVYLCTLMNVDSTIYVVDTPQYRSMLKYITCKLSLEIFSLIKNIFSVILTFFYPIHLCIWIHIFRTDIRTISFPLAPKFQVKTSNEVTMAQNFEKHTGLKSQNRCGKAAPTFLVHR